MIYNTDYRKVMREGRRILKNSEPETYYHVLENYPSSNWITILLGIAIVTIILITCFSGCACAYTVDQYANAIYKAEGGSKTRHPYGVLKHYNHTTARQVCINTIKHQYRRWNKQGDFVKFLGNVYCPVGAFNDPLGLNNNWVNNVNMFLRKGN